MTKPLTEPTPATRRWERARDATTAKLKLEIRAKGILSMRSRKAREAIERASVREGRG